MRKIVGEKYYGIWDSRTENAEPWFIGATSIESAFKGLSYVNGSDSSYDTVIEFQITKAFKRKEIPKPALDSFIEVDL